MHIKTTKEALLKAVTTAAKAVPSKVPTPFMENLLFEEKPGGFSIIATDGEIIITTYTQSEAEGSACLSAKTVVELVKVLPDGDITINTTEKTARVEWGTGHSDIPTFPTDEFPDVKPAYENGCAFNAASIHTAIAHALPHVATDILRPQLTGVHFHPNNETTDVVGTDSHTVCVYPVMGGLERPFTISAKSAAIIRDAATEADTVGIFVSDSRISFQCGDVVISMPEIIGKFPDYSRVVPTDNQNVLTADTRSLIQQIRRVAVCSNKTSNHIRLDLKPLSSSISAQDLGFGTSAHETLDADYDGNDLSIGFKHDFLIKSIGVFDGEKVSIKFGDARHPALVTSDGDPAICVVMPIAIQ